MKCFMDEEFTGLHKDTTLISLGIVSDSGQTFYCEFTDYDREQIDEWLEKNVIVNCRWINGKESKGVNNYSIQNAGTDNSYAECYGDKRFVKECLTAWLKDFKEPIELYSDCCHYDMVLFCDLFGGALRLPSFISPVCHDINQDIAKYFNISGVEAFDLDRMDYVKDEIDTVKNANIKHNALLDAIVIKTLYNVIKGDSYEKN